MWSHIFAHGVRQRFLHSCAGLEPHASGNAHLLGADKIDRAGVDSARWLQLIMEKVVVGMEGMGEAVLVGMLPACNKVFSVSVHVRQNIYTVVLEHFIQFPQVRPALLMKLAVQIEGTRNTQWSAMIRLCRITWADRACII